jgi:hypothetical protein
MKAHAMEWCAACPGEFSWEERSQWTGTKTDADAKTQISAMEKASDFNRPMIMGRSGRRKQKNYFYPIKIF